MNNDYTIENTNMLLAHTFNIPNQEYFLNIVKEVPINILGYRSKVLKKLEEKFHPYFRINFSDNDFATSVLKACQDFYNDFSNLRQARFYMLYEDLEQQKISIQTFLKKYLLHKVYGDKIGDRYRFGSDAKLPTLYNDTHLFNYINNLIKVEKIEYLPDEFSLIKREEIFRQQKEYLKKEKMSTIVNSNYLYTNMCWNSEDCFISMKDESEYDGNIFLI